MSHFAKVENGIVTWVIKAEKDFIDEGNVGDPKLWIQTSYNTRRGVHYDPLTNEPDNGIALRGNYAGIGMIYDSTHDVFYNPCPKDRNGIECSSWTISAPDWFWKPPTPIPETGGPYAWDEPTKSWVEKTAT